MYWLFRIFFSFAIILYSVLSTWSRSFLWPPSRTLLQKAFSLECLLKVFSTHIHTHTQLQKVFSLECLLKVLSMVSFYLFTCSDFSEVLCSEVPSWSWIMRGTSSKKSLFFAFESVLYSVCSKLIMQYVRHIFSKGPLWWFCRRSMWRRIHATWWSDRALPVCHMRRRIHASYEEEDTCDLMERQG